MGKRNYLLALCFLFFVLILIIGSRFFILKNKYEKLALDFAIEILENGQTINTLTQEKNELVREYNDGVYFNYPLGLNIKEVMSYTNYIPGTQLEGVERKAYEAKRDIWEYRIKNKDFYRLSDSCLPENKNEEDNNGKSLEIEDSEKVGCSVYNLKDYFVVKYVDKDSFDYIVLDDFSEYVFSFEEDNDDVFNVILNSFKYTRN